jgi:membrane protein required for colicin V production
MFIDIVLAAVLVSAIFKGYSKGLIFAVLSFLALFVGLAAGLKLSATVAGWLQKNTSIGTNWLPFLSFALVMFGTVLLIRFVAKFLEKATQFAMLGWVNKIGGIALFVLLYVSILSIVFFYMIQMGLLSTEQIATSKTYPYFKNWGEKAIAIFNVLVPVFKDVFNDLQNFFQNKAAVIS